MGYLLDSLMRINPELPPLSEWWLLYGPLVLIAASPLVALAGFISVIREAM